VIENSKTWGFIAAKSYVPSEIGYRLSARFASHRKIKLLRVIAVGRE